MKNFIILAVLVLILSLVVSAQVPNKISYQGLLTTPTGTPVIDGSYNLQFDIYNLPTSGLLRHSEMHNSVLVLKGTFSVALGPFTPIFSESLFIEVTALTGPAPGLPITFSPRSELTSAPYSLAPWVTSGNNIFFSGGNVGIGTASPLFGARLEVVDRFNVIGTGTSRVFIAKDGINYLDLSYDAGAARGQITTFNSSQPLILQQLGGNVGIGTTSPNEKIEINHGTSATMRLYATGGAGRPYNTSATNTGRYLIRDVNAAVDRIEIDAVGNVILRVDDGNNQRGVYFYDNDGNELAKVLDNGTSGLISFNGKVGIGTTSPQGALDVSSTTGAFIVPRMTTAQRDALTPVNGMIIYNTTTNQFNFRENSAWVTK